MSPTATVLPSGLNATEFSMVRLDTVPQPVTGISHRQRYESAMASVEPKGLKASDDTLLPR
jgi:hypothetical protein